MEIIRDKNVIAKKDHVCNWCGCTIPAGEKYKTVTCKGDTIYTWKSHLRCLELFHKLEMDEDGFGINSCDFQEIITEEYIIIKSKQNEKVKNLPPFKEQIDLVYNYIFEK